MKAWPAALLGVVLAGAGSALAQSTEGRARLFDPASAPFVPVPEIDLDPNAGTTLGLIPVWLRENAAGEIRQILAPDLIHSTYFGYGARGRIFVFPSADTQ
ncbi:MAG: hypothetical protein JO005_15240, partial [Gammaproteobacteria bacterium]|nr:hypothetical protein [Gammaproteobacteria bacterium]